jgi:hypothetical protein
MDFDFESIAGTFNRITSTNSYTKDKIQIRWAELHKERKIAKTNVMDRLFSKENRNILELMDEIPDEEMKAGLPAPKNFLKVTQEDLEKSRSVSALTGELIKPSGNISCAPTLTTQ